MKKLIAAIVLGLASFGASADFVASLGGVTVVLNEKVACPADIHKRIPQGMIALSKTGFRAGVLIGPTGDKLRLCWAEFTPDEFLIFDADGDNGTAPTMVFKRVEGI